MVKRLVAFTLIPPLLVLFVIWSNHNAEQMERKVDRNVCEIRQGC